MIWACCRCAMKVEIQKFVIRAWFSSTARRVPLSSMATVAPAARISKRILDGDDGPDGGDS